MKEFEKKILVLVEDVSSKESGVRRFINLTHFQNDLIKDHNVWNQICSCLDLIGDVCVSIEHYIKTDYPKDVGIKYLFTYGLLQALFLQQDAVRFLVEAFEIEEKLSEPLKEIRHIRNASIGHPTKQNVKGVTFYNYISRPSLNKYGFTLLRSSESRKSDSVEVKLHEIVISQVTEIEKLLMKIISFLKEEDKQHKEKFKGELMSKKLNHTSYYLEKVHNGVNGRSMHDVEFAISMLDAAKKDYKKFEEELMKRKELTDQDHISEEMRLNIHGIERLKQFLKNDTSLSKDDAIIILDFLYGKLDLFVQIAKEVDEKYQID